MDKKAIEALARKNAAKAANTSGRKGFGKKYDATLKEAWTDIAPPRAYQCGRSVR